MLPIFWKLKMADLVIKGVLKLIPGDSQEKKYDKLKTKFVDVLKQIPDELLKKGLTDEQK